MNPRFIALTLLLHALSFAGEARAQCLDWTPGYHLTGIDGLVRVTAVFDDGTGNGPELYVGGQFQAATDVAASNIAKWNGVRWAPVGSGRPNSVFALHVWDDGSGPALWAGSVFGNPASGLLADVLAKWDGNTWTAPAAGATITPGVFALTSYDDGSGPALFVGARFTAIGGTTLPYGQAVARYDGSAWSQLGSGLATGFTPLALIVHDDGSGPKLFAGGELRADPGAAQGFVWRWNGSSWITSGAGWTMDGGATCFGKRATGTGAIELYASRGFTSTGIKKLMRWTGAGWTSVGGNINGDVYALLGVDPPSGPGTLYVAGSANNFGGVLATAIAAWDGQVFSPLAASLPSSVVIAYALGLYDEGQGARLFAGGTGGFTAAPDARGIARFDGATWSTLGTSVGYPLLSVGDLQTLNGAQGPALYAAFGNGSFVGVGRWNGAGLTPVGAAFNGSLWKLGAYDDGVHGEQLYACGGFTQIGGSPVDRVARWDGANWLPLGSGFSTLVAPYVPTLRTMIVHEGKLIVAGNYTTAGGAPAAIIGAWNGTTWSVLGSVLNNSTVLALESYDDGMGPALYAGGWFNWQGIANLTRWNGSAWVGVGGGTSALIDVVDLHVHDDGSGPRLYAAGQYSATSWFPFASWDGTNWRAEGSGTPLAELTSYDDGSGRGPRLYAAAAVPSSAVTAGTRSAAVWDGTAWHALGGGTDSYVSSIEVFDDGDPNGPALFLSGTFTRAGAYASARIARWSRTGACASSTGLAYCFGDGSTGACPCGNVGAIGRGCDNSAVSTGARLSAEGQAMISADSVTLRVDGATPFGTVLFFQGTTKSGGGAGVTFGDGLRCVSGQQIRLAIRAASAGDASFGRAIPGDASVSRAGNLHAGSWATRHYQAFYRDSQSFCTSSTFNLSNGLTLRWSP